MAKIQTHEQYVQAIYRLAMRSKLLTADDRKTLLRVKLTYGDRNPAYLGATHFGAWHPNGCCGGKKKGKPADAHPLVTIGAMPGETNIELCHTVLHELGHVLAGLQAGHDAAWVKSCEKLGLLEAKASGDVTGWDQFAEPLRKSLRELRLPGDGAPVRPEVKINGDGRPEIVGIAEPGPRPTRTCGAGYGTRGGKSRGPGSGSRHLLWECKCEKPFKVRCARELDARCNKCKSKFELVESSIPPAQGGDNE